MPLSHNKSSVRLPDGLNKNELKIQVQLCSALTERERCLLVYVLDQAEDWIHTVTVIRERMQWGEERWRKVRTGLQAKKVLAQQKTELAKNSHEWSLIFDFVIVLDICLNCVAGSKLSTDTAKTRGSHARARSPLPPGDHVSLPPGQG